ncbi:MAG TPA: GntR family transcriptional regulator [Stellaceae bacterium]|nr:GntR family transcriptional regulator [Stellaceae bacterium]
MALREGSAEIDIAPLAARPAESPASFRILAYRKIKELITGLNVYGQAEPIRLDERRLSQELGVSRTPVREALTLLEREGYVRTEPRRGVIVMRKSKQEILRMIEVWAALESLAARLATLHAADDEIASLRRMFEDFSDQSLEGHLDEYSEANIHFHQAIIRLSGNPLLVDMTRDLFIHMRAIRQATIGQGDRAKRSIVDHMNIIEALERRDTERAAALVLKHALDLAAHVEQHWNSFE